MQHYSILIAGVLSSVLILAVFLYLIRNIFKRNSSYQSIDELRRTGVEIFKCPRCSTQMEYGYRMANQGIIWRRENEKIKMVAPERMLENTMNFTFKNKENPAWHCKTCKLLLIDHNHLVGN